MKAKIRPLFSLGVQMSTLCPISKNYCPSETKWKKFNLILCSKIMPVPVEGSLNEVSSVSAVLMQINLGYE